MRGRNGFYFEGMGVDMGRRGVEAQPGARDL